MPPTSPPAPPSDPASPQARLERARTFLLRCFLGEPGPTAEGLLAPDVVYRVPGHNRLAGTFHGPDELRSHLTRLVEITQGDYDTLQWEDWMVGENYVAVLANIYMETDGRRFQGHQLFLFDFRPDGLIRQVDVYFRDPDLADRVIGR